MWSFCAPAAHQKKTWKNSSTRKFCFRGQSQPAQRSRTLLKHYAPNHPLRINAATRQPGEFFIGFGKIADCDLNLSPAGDLREAAANLFAFLRRADAAPGYTGLAMSPVPEHGLGLAINDRIRRASYKA